MFLGLIFYRRMGKYTPNLSNMVPTMCVNRINIHMNYMCYRNNWHHGWFGRRKASRRQKCANSTDAHQTALNLENPTWNIKFADKTLQKPKLNAVCNMPNTKTSKRYLKCSSAFIHPLKLFEQVVPTLNFAVTRLGQYCTRKSKRII